MSTHNICLLGEIRKIFTVCPILSRPMQHSCFGEIREISVVFGCKRCLIYSYVVMVTSSYEPQSE